jgi:hypothetical protein
MKTASSTHKLYDGALLGATSSRHLPDNLTRIVSTRSLGPTLTISYMVPTHPPFIFAANCVADQTDFDDFRAWRRSATALQR